MGISRESLVVTFRSIKMFHQAKTVKLPFAEHGRELKWRKVCFVKLSSQGLIIRIRAVLVVEVNHLEDISKEVMGSSSSSNRMGTKRKEDISRSSSSTDKAHMAKILCTPALLKLNFKDHHKHMEHLRALHRYLSGKLRQHLMVNSTIITKDREKRLGRSPQECHK